MITYEYQCDGCGHRFEKTQGIKEEPLKGCPDCGAPVRRLLSGGAGVIFRGSGFHSTDYTTGGGTKTRCGSERTCCGRETPCDTPSCDQ